MVDASITSIEQLHAALTRTNYRHPRFGARSTSVRSFLSNVYPLSKEQEITDTELLAIMKELAQWKKRRPYCLHGSNVWAREVVASVDKTSLSAAEYADIRIKIIHGSQTDFQKLLLRDQIRYDDIAHAEVTVRTREKDAAIDRLEHAIQERKTVCEAESIARGAKLELSRYKWNEDDVKGIQDLYDNARWVEYSNHCKVMDGVIFPYDDSHFDELGKAYSKLEFNADKDKAVDAWVHTYCRYRTGLLGCALSLHVGEQVVFAYPAFPSGSPHEIMFQLLTRSADKTIGLGIEHACLVPVAIALFQLFLNAIVL